jgi:hypothetical protein
MYPAVEMTLRSIAFVQLSRRVMLRLVRVSEPPNPGTNLLPGPCRFNSVEVPNEDGQGVGVWVRADLQLVETRSAMDAQMFGEL